MVVIRRFAAVALLGFTQVVHAQAWRPDAGPGLYRNPIIFADYSDPDVIRVGDDFYLTSSSFESVPALPILHSRDLVHWTIINHAIQRLGADFDVPQHGNGVWAPSIRFHAGWYYIYYGDPDRGIYMVRTRDARRSWDPPVLVRAAKGWIDPCPLWDDDGNAYLVHAFANSRAGVKSILHVNRMSAGGTQLLDDGTLVFDGHANHPTIEGPKFYKRDGWYYIFAPAGGVPTGWQTVLRSRRPLGPYEDRVVMRQGKSPINGPHQGGWVTTSSGDDWFIHFQDRGAAGRVVHLQPMAWRNDGWPVIGDDADGDGVGEPVLEHAIPHVRSHVAGDVLQASDEFSARTLGVQWQWQANPRHAWLSFRAHSGWLRLFAMHDSSDNLWSQPNVLLQKFAGPAFVASTQLTLSGGDADAGLVILGMDYATIGLRRSGDMLEVISESVIDAPGKATRAVARAPVTSRTIDARVTCTEERCRFEFRTKGREWTSIGTEFVPRAGRWVGAKIGLFVRGNGYADFDFLRVKAP